MSAFSAAAQDEDGDEIKALREQLARVTAQLDQLLVAAKLCRPHMYDHASNTQDCAFDRLCAAIAKAGGAA